MLFSSKIGLDPVVQEDFRSAGLRLAPGDNPDQQNGVQTSMPLSGSCLCPNNRESSALLSIALIEVNPTLKLR